MADFCCDCTLRVFGTGVIEGAHDLPRGRAWYLCEGCGAHVFDEGMRICRTPQNEAEKGVGLAPCPRCLELWE